MATVRQAFPFEFVLMLGDNIYGGNSASDFQTKFERPYKPMLDAGETPRADVLKVAHHGSRTSTTEEFLSAVAPTFAIVSAGFENSYGHPHPDILDRLERHHAVVLRTDLDGLITVRSDGRRLFLGTYNGFLGGL